MWRISTRGDEASRHFALRGNLMQLHLSEMRFGLPLRLSRAAIEGVLSWTQPGCRAAEYLYCAHTGTYKLIYWPESQLQRPFDQLTSLTVAEATGRSIAPLALLMQLTLTHLVIAVVDVPENSDNADARTIFEALAALQQLQQLQVVMSLHTRFGSGVDVVALSSLTQLRSLRLRLTPHWSVSLNDAQLLALLEPLGQLRALSLSVGSHFLVSRCTSRHWRSEPADLPSRAIDRVGVRLRAGP
jgi:hypothetical protein